MHSTSFLIDSDHFDHLVPLIDEVFFHGHIVQLHGMYRPSTREKVGTAPIAVEVAIDDIFVTTFSVSTLIDFLNVFDRKLYIESVTGTTF